MENFDDYFYRLTLEFESLKTRAEKDEFYGRHKKKAKEMAQANGVGDFGIRRVRNNSGAARWQSWALTQNKKLVLNSHSYSSKGIALMSVLYGIHTGRL